MLPLATVILNVTLALFCGLAIDKFYGKLRADVAVHWRIVMQFATLIAAVYAIDWMFQRLKIETISESAFFISVFLGVQTRLFRDIETASEKWKF